AKSTLQMEFQERKISITPNSFTDLGRFVPKTKKKIMVFSAARLMKNKNPMLLINAVVLVQDFIREKGYKIIICGQGYEEDNLKKKVNEENLNDIIQYLGYVDTYPYITEAEVFFSL